MSKSEGNSVSCVLTQSRLVVRDERIEIEGDPISDVLSGRNTDAEFKDRLGAILECSAESLDIGLQKYLGLRASGVGLAGRLHKGVSRHKGLHKGLHKSLHKGLHKGASIGGPTGGPLLDWPEILPPWLELRRLQEADEAFHWTRLDDHGLLPAPRSPQEQFKETLDVLAKQKELRKASSEWRRARIEAEATNDISAYMVPLGTDLAAPGSETSVLFQMVLWLGNIIGLYYKERFAAARPHVVNPSIEPYLPVPAFSAYPSNHAFQSFLIAEVFSRTVPEHSGLLELYHAAGQVAINREYAGLHIRSDTKAGQRLARLCAPMIEYVLEEQILRVRGEWY